MTTLVLLPGMDGTGDLYGAFRQTLGANHKLVVVTYPTDLALAYDALENLACSALPLDEDYVLIGESFSGPIAISIAASKPARLKALILCASFAHNPYPQLKIFKPVIPYLPVRAAPSAILVHFLLGQFSSTSLSLQLADALAKVSAKALKARLTAVLSIDVREKLSKICVPALYLRATKDRVVPASAFECIRVGLPSINVIELDAPHFLLQVKPVEAVQSIFAFIRDKDKP